MIERRPRSICVKNRKESFELLNLSGFFAHFNKAIVFFAFLCGFFYWKQVASRSLILYFCVQFIQIISHAQ